MVSGSFHSAIRKFTPKNSKGESRSLHISEVDKSLNFDIVIKNDKAPSSDCTNIFINKLKKYGKF